VWHAIDDHTYRNELVWREFTHSTLWDRPDLLERPFRKEFEDFPWREDDRGWNAWVEGRTGYPVVDAAARQLLATGFVHNRARMIAASFLTKHLMIDYRRGEAHYMKWLTDGDWAQNNFNWQWSAGCGCDAQPYFRIFNPQLQEAKFDASGDYVRRWIPGRMSSDYPPPIVEHTEARERFLAIATGHTKKARRS
jgi:deoxyribodipyrimidine photo-lyase